MCKQRDMWIYPTKNFESKHFKILMKYALQIVSNIMGSRENHEYNDFHGKHIQLKNSYPLLGLRDLQIAQAQ